VVDPPWRGNVIQSPEIKTDDTTTPPDEPQATGRAPGNGRRVQRTVNFDREILDRARAAATYLARNEPEAGIRSLADIVNPAVAARVAELEARFNDGEPFQPVGRMPPGRRAGRPTPVVTLAAEAHPPTVSDS
jgi:hypothetical protein